MTVHHGGRRMMYRDHRHESASDKSNTHTCQQDRRRRRQLAPRPNLLHCVAGVGRGRGRGGRGGGHGGGLLPRSVIDVCRTAALRWSIVPVSESNLALSLKVQAHGPVGPRASHVVIESSVEADAGLCYPNEL